MNQKKKKTPVELSLIETAEAVRDGTIDPAAHVGTFLTGIREHASLNSFVTVCETESLARAESLSKKIKAGNSVGRLAGCVIALKDNINLTGCPTGCASKILDHYDSPYNATVADLLLREDAIIIGKTNMDEFAMGSSTENSAFGPARNPAAPDRVPGGSSGGSAAAVAAGISQAALGSDTGGSIRQPAAFTGLTGIKPTYGRVSRYGLVAFASSFDQIGPLTRSVEDAALILQIISGHDLRDATTADISVPDFTRTLKISPGTFTVGIPRQFLTEGLAADIRERLDEVIGFLDSGGVRIIDVDLPHATFGIAVYYILATAEASSNLARYDGIKYGYRTDKTRGLNENYRRTRSEGFGDEVKRRIMLGTYVLSSGYYDAYYRKAQQVRQLIRRDFDKVYKQVDCLLLPTTPTTAFRIGEKTDNPLEMYLSDIYTVLSNLAGHCAMSIPCGRDQNGLPIGMQILADAFEEDKMLRLAYLIEQNMVF
jgi:aspartyl-tRNA(Asn)/glutamyl-tRNA(Gln) amidotransferase subunit A